MTKGRNWWSRWYRHWLHKACILLKTPDIDFKNPENKLPLMVSGNFNPEPDFKIEPKEFKQNEASLD